MIRLPDNFGIMADENQYIFGKVLTRKTNKIIGGAKTEVFEEYISQPSYFPSVESCIKKLLKIKQRELVAENELSLPETLRKFEMLQERFERLLKEVCKEDLN